MKETLERAVELVGPADELRIRWDDPEIGIRPHDGSDAGPVRRVLVTSVAACCAFSAWKGSGSR